MKSNKRRRRNNEDVTMHELTQALTDLYRLEERLIRTANSIRGKSDDNASLVYSNTDCVEDLIVGLIKERAVYKSENHARVA